MSLISGKDFFKAPDSSPEAREVHSRLVDDLLGFEILRIEMELLEEARELYPQGNLQTWGHSLHEGNQTWVGLDHQVLQTPYDELLEMASLLNPLDEEFWIDLGAGYGRLGLMLNFLYPHVRFEGYEYVSDRVREGQRILEKYQCSKARLLEQDLQAPEFSLPDANVYFVYDYGKVSHIRHTLKQIEEKALSLKFKLIARGRGTRSLIEHEHPWLTVNPVIHRETFSIYGNL